MEGRWDENAVRAGAERGEAETDGVARQRNVVNPTLSAICPHLQVRATDIVTITWISFVKTCIIRSPEGSVTTNGL
jgi:hypothetical protein